MVNRLKKNINFIIMFFVICFIGMIGLDRVCALNSSYLGTSDIHNFDSCGDVPYNGCISRDGYRYTIVKFVNQNSDNDTVTYVKVSQKSFISSETFGSDWETLRNEVIKGGDFFNKILEGTGVDRSTFLSNLDYAILIEPLFSILYNKNGLPSTQWYPNGTYTQYPTTGSATAKEVASFALKNYSTLTGIRSVSQIFPCTLYVPSLNSNSDDWMCKVDFTNKTNGYTTYKNKYDRNYKPLLELSTSENSRYGKAFIWVTDIGRKLTVQKVDENGNPISGVKFSYRYSGNTFGDKYSNTDGKIMFLGLPINGTTVAFTEYVPDGYDASLTTCISSANSTCIVVDENGDGTPDVGYNTNIGKYFVKFEIKYTGGDDFVTIINKKAQKGKLKIQKKNLSGSFITGDTATFGIYSDSSCKTIVQTVSTKKGSGISDEISLTKGTYYYKETKAPSGYVVGDNGTCHSFSITANKTTTLTVTDKTECEYDFGTNPSVTKRIELYQKYQAKGKEYRNLLNFNITNAASACTSKTCSNSIDLGCLSAKTNNVTFNMNDISCYTTTLDSVGGKTAYCRESFSLNAILTGTSKYYSTHNFSTDLFAKAGQMILKKDSRNIASSILTKTCYVYGSSIAKNDSIENLNIDSNFSYSNYTNLIKNVKFNGKILEIDEDKFNDDEDDYNDYGGKGWFGSSNGTYASFSKSIRVYYNLNAVYAQNGSGKTTTTYCSNCKFLGYGVVSKLTDKKGTVYGIPFSINIGVINNSIKGVKSNNNACIYTVGDGIVEPLKLEFRIIDTSNPFPSKDGDGRQVGDNWCSKSFDVGMQNPNSCLGNIPCYIVGQDGTVNFNDLNIIKDKIGTNELTYDLNKNGIVDNIDEKLIRYSFGYSKINTVGKNCDSNNIYASYIMKSTNNSYDKNKTGAKYTITLTSSDIKLIRTYNSKTTYDDYKFKCTDGENCTSNFLTQLKNGSLTGIGSLSNKLIYKG